jgi:hypothetical protein
MSQRFNVYESDKLIAGPRRQRSTSRSRRLHTKTDGHDPKRCTAHPVLMNPAIRTPSAAS